MRSLSRSSSTINSAGVDSVASAKLSRSPFHMSPDVSARACFSATMLPAANRSMRVSKSLRGCSRTRPRVARYDFWRRVNCCRCFWLARILKNLGDVVVDGALGDTPRDLVRELRQREVGVPQSRLHDLDRAS